MARPPSPRREASLRRSAPAEEATHTMVGRRTLWSIILAAIFVVLGIVIGMAIVSKRDSHPIDVPPPGAEVPLLKDPGPWKEKADGPQTDGVEVEGQGRVLFGTGEGRDPGGTIALDAVPEAPMEIPAEGHSPAPQAPAAPPKEVLKEAPKEAAKPALPKPAEPHPAKPPAAKSEKAEKPVNLLPEKLHPSTAPAASPAPEKGSDSASLQLGAFSSSASAQAAWKSLSGRLSYLSGHEPVISPVTRDGKTLYRLRIHAGSTTEAQNLCQRLKVAGEACSVVH